MRVGVRSERSQAKAPKGGMLNAGLQGKGVGPSERVHSNAHSNRAPPSIGPSRGFIGAL